MIKSGGLNGLHKSPLSGQQGSTRRKKTQGFEETEDPTDAVSLKLAL